MHSEKNLHWHIYQPDLLDASQLISIFEKIPEYVDIPKQHSLSKSFKNHIRENLTTKISSNLSSNDHLKVILSSKITVEKSIAQKNILHLSISQSDKFSDQEIEGLEQFRKGT